MEKEKDKDKDKDRTSTVRQSVQFVKPKLGSRQTSESTTHTTGTRYEELPEGKPPIPITVAPRPSSARIENHPSFRQEASSPEPPVPSVPQGLLDGASSSGRQFQLLRNDPRPDSAVAGSSDTARDSHITAATTTSTVTDSESLPSVKKTQSLPRIKGSIAAATTPMADNRAATMSGPKPRARLAKKQSRDVAPAGHEEAPFVGLTTDIPSVTFDDFIEPEKIEFSKRGSMLIGERKATELRHLRGPSRDTTSIPTIPPIRVISPEEEIMSLRVRSMYNTGVGEMPMVPEGEAVSHGEGGATGDPAERMASPSPEPQSIRVVSAMSGQVADSDFVASSLRGSVIREEHELAGGFEDWQDVEGGDVDRYGFINPRPKAGTSSFTSLQASHSPHLHRMSTQLQQAAETRRGSSRLGRSPSTGKSTRSVQDLKSSNQRERTVRPMSSQSSYRSTGSSSSRIRTATNRLPHNRSRRVMDEAGDMLTLPPGLADIAAAKDDGRASARQKAKEWEREGKWRKMARMTRRDGKGGGMTFSFDTRDPKLISRTWKGIPDRWRATAWQSFLTESARRRGGQPSDTELRDAFEKLQEIPSPDDMQIDTDVPRTIGAHIMFRTRYRGGQRLLFRVLHALSLFFPETGYVQGMAALAATLLCYFDEAATFSMLVRLWMLRGLDRLYSPGFGGLMTALDELERHWMAGGAVGAKLHELGIAPTSFGTRWYLTLFNYSIPFPAQLRVWDVFFLLGDPERPYPMPVTALEWLREGGRKNPVDNAAEEAAKAVPAEKAPESKPKEKATEPVKPAVVEKAPESKPEEKAEWPLPPTLAEKVPESRPKEELSWPLPPEVPAKVPESKPKEDSSEPASQRATSEPPTSQPTVVPSTEDEEKPKEQVDKAKEAAAEPASKRATSEPPAKPAPMSRKEKKKKAKKEEEERKAREKKEKEEKKKEKKEKKKAKKAPLPSAAAANRPRNASTAQQQQPKPEPEPETATKPAEEPAAEDRPTSPTVDANRTRSPALAPAAAPSSPPASPPASPPGRALSPTLSHGRSPSAALAPGRAPSRALAPGTVTTPPPPTSAAAAVAAAGPPSPTPAPLPPPVAPLPPPPAAAPAAAPAPTPAPAPAPAPPPTAPVPPVAASIPPEDPPLPEVPASTSSKQRATTPASAPSTATKNKNKKPADSFHGGLDVLHATSAALVDATREILLDSDFENAMKTLTSWVPVQDEELLMKVAMTEYRRGRKRRGR